MKKILSLVLVAATMLSLVVFAPAASAADSYTVEITDATASAGDQVTLDVLVTGASMYSYAFGFQYDATRLENPVITQNSEYFVEGSAIKGNDWQTSYTTNVKGTVGAFAITEPTSVATITFDVKADAPAGDAFVTCAPFSNAVDIFIAPTNDFINDAVFSWEAVDGIVSILPEGLAAGVAPSAGEDFGYVNNGNGTCTINAYSGKGGDVIIPSEIDGLTVVGLASYMFVTATVQSNATVTSVTIPETVENIANYCMVNLSACTDIYVLNPAAVIGIGALAWDAALTVARGKITGVSDAWTKSADYVTPDTTIHGFTGSTADTYANTPDAYGLAPGWAVYAPAKNVTLVTPNGTASYVAAGDTVALPESYAAAGKTIVGWSVNGNVVAPGSVAVLDGDATIEAVTVGFATENGAAIKAVTAAEDLALRFTVALNKADYAALETIYGAENISHGMLIVPQQYITRAGGFTHAALEAAGLQKLDYKMTGCYTETADEYILAASIKGFHEVTRAKNPRFAAIGYIAITIGEVTTYVYSDYDASTARDAKFVLQNSSFTGDQAKWVSDLLDMFS